MIQTATFNVQADPKNTKILSWVRTVSAGHAPLANVFNNDTGILQPNASFAAPTLNTTLYAEPGTLISCNALTKAANPLTGLPNFTCVLNGYYVTLP